MGFELKNATELGLMRQAGRIVAETLDLLEAASRPGVALAELDRLAAEHMHRSGATSSFLGYHGYPKVLCTSVNEVVVHGIPDGRRLVEGDIVGLDFGVIFQGFNADAARTVAVGPISPEATRLIEATRTALDRAIEAFGKRDARIGDIGQAVQSYVEQQGFSVVRDFVGHGIGRRMHEPPQVANYGPGGSGQRVRKGLVLAIEPMVNAGGWEVEVMEDRWTAKTKDRQLSAHFEHTVALTENGPEILTRLPG